MPPIRDDGPIWLDVSRLLSRIGRDALTGVDRVEFAYLDHVLADGGPDARFLCRTTRGFLLLPPEGGKALADAVRGELTLPCADPLSRLAGRGDRPRHRAEALLRGLAIDRCLRGRLARMISCQPMAPAFYLNTGHSNLSKQVLPAIAAAQAKVAILIHDLIPLTHPETVAADMPDRFATRIENVRRSADLVICNSAVTEADLARHWADADRRPETVIAPLGLSRCRPMAVPKDPRAFVILGTLEPRKNHALLLDVWEALARELPREAMPHLHIIGARGWRVDDLLSRIDSHPLKDIAIFDHGPLPDHLVEARLAAANALLFPSLAEGYGLPPLEALQLGTLPICSSLPVLVESLGPNALYVPNSDSQSWAETIKKRMDGMLAPVSPPAGGLPTWKEHFDRVGAALAACRAEGR